MKTQKNPNQIGNVYEVVPKAKQIEAMNWLQANAFASPTWIVNINTLKNTGYAGYTETFRNIQVRHLNNLLSLPRIGRLMDNEILGADTYKALDFFKDLRKGIWKEAASATNVTIYRRNLQRAYIDRMGGLMTEEIKPNDRSATYYNAAQSDLRALVRGELNALKKSLVTAKATAVNTETKYHYEDCIKRIDLILNPIK